MTDANADKKRRLGDEWEDWNGYDEGIINEGKGLFITFASFVVVLVNAGLFVTLYFVYPRLAQLHPALPMFVFISVVLFLLVSILWSIQLFLTSIFETNFFFKKAQAFIAFEVLFNKVFNLATLLRISRDRMGHSFIKVSNSITRAYIKEIPQDKKGKILILLPRCLKKEQLQQLNSFKEKYNLEVATVPGGELARKKVKEIRPSFIIGVACERDLVSGIRDVASKIPALGVINKRPEGPCINTFIDMDEIEDAIQFYLK
ncbi:DUF116 domain-containing protein [bacterium]|nr:DUF116 domain-containing protein [bacterium]